MRDSFQSRRPDDAGCQSCAGLPPARRAELEGLPRQPIAAASRGHHDPFPRRREQDLRPAFGHAQAIGHALCQSGAVSMPDRCRSRDMYSLECDPGARVTAVTLQIQSRVRKPKVFERGNDGVGTRSDTVVRREVPFDAEPPSYAVAGDGRGVPESMCPLWGSHLATSQPRTCIRPVGMAIVVADGRGRTGRIERHRPRMGQDRRYTTRCNFGIRGIRRQRLGQCRIGGRIKN